MYLVKFPAKDNVAPDCRVLNPRLLARIARASSKVNLCNSDSSSSSSAVQHQRICTSYLVRQRVRGPTHTHTHTHTHSHTHSHTLTHSHTHTLSLTHTHSLSHTHTHTPLPLGLLHNATLQPQVQRTAPAEGSSSPRRDMSSDDFPEPTAPTTATSFPGVAVSDTPLSVAVSFHLPPRNKKKNQEHAVSSGKKRHEKRKSQCACLGVAVDIVGARSRCARCSSYCAEMFATCTYAA